MGLVVSEILTPEATVRQSCNPLVSIYFLARIVKSIHLLLLKIIWAIGSWSTIILSPKKNDICAGIPDGPDEDIYTEGFKDSCKGDSGGPLICPIDGKAALVGIVSNGQGIPTKDFPEHECG